MRKVFLPLLMGLVTMVASCTAIPSSGPVISAQIEATTSSVDVDFLPPGPSAGATPEEIVAGFIAAGAAAQDNYRVAKSYLAESVRDEWNPNAGVIIRSGEPDISVVTNNTVQYVVPAMASVDELGRYFEGASSAEQALDFRFTKELGEWRLSVAPDGVVLTESAFSEAFHSYRLYYFSAGYRELVADVRWFATRGEVSAKIVRALLEAPSFWLEQGATVSAFPEGTQLALTPIPVVDGVARVDLTTAVVSADELTRSRMIAQLTASLTQVQGISSATISVNQNELLIPTLGEDGPTLITGRDPRLAVVKDRRFGFIQARKVELIEPLAADIATLDAHNVFYSATFGQALVNRSDGLWRVDGVSEPVLIDPRVTGVRAIMDNCGLVWSSASQSGPEMLTIVDQNGQLSPLALDIGAEASLVSLELARDDTRLLALVQTDTGVRVLLAAVTRDDDCRPTSLGEFIELAPLAGEAVDAAWVDDSTFAVVTKDSLTGVGAAVIFDSSGRSSSLGQPLAPVALVGGVGGVSGLRLLSEDGAIYQPRGNGWQATGDRASVLVTQR
jgi:hypothetical protein